MNDMLIKPARTHALTLGVFALIVALLVMFSTQWLNPVIQEQIHNDQLLKIQQVLPNSLYDNDPSALPMSLTMDNGQTLHYFLATRHGAPSAFIFHVAAQGYSGPIELMIALLPNGEISGVRVISHQETPGLGDKIEVDKSDWILQFTGLSLTNPLPSHWRVSKDGGDFSAFTGATITPRGVVKAIKQMLINFKHYHDILMTVKEAKHAN